MKWSAPWKSSLPGKIDRNIAYTFAAIQDRRLQGAANFDIIAIRLLLWLFFPDPPIASHEAERRKRGSGSKERFQDRIGRSPGNVRALR